MENLDFINSVAKNNSDKVNGCGENLADNETPNLHEDFKILSELLDALEEGKLTQELFDKFNNIPNHVSCWKRIKVTLRSAFYDGIGKEE